MTKHSTPICRGQRHLAGFTGWNSNPYLTPARVSDHLFNPQGNKTTIAPKRIIAYIWDIISMHHHLLSVPHSPWHILHYKCCGQIVKNIDQKCLQSKIILPNNEKIGILLNDKLTKKGKRIIGQKGKLPENMRSLSSATTDIECANGLLLRRSIWRDQSRFRLFWRLQRISWQADWT